MTDTNNLKLTLLEQNQAQKEITVNEAFARIDAVLNKGVIDKDLSTPPVSPISGDLYIVASSPTGSWSGQADKIAWYNQTWQFIAPNEGFSLWVNDEDLIYTYSGSAWVALSTGGGGGSSTLSGLTDVNIASPADQSFLVYDNASSKWVNKSPSNARISMGLGSVATLASSAVAQTANNLSDLASASTARTNLGLGSIATQASSSVTVTGGTINGTTVGATTAAAGSFTTISASGTVTFSGSVVGGNISINAQTGTTYTVTSSDNGKVITLNNASAVTVTVPQTSTESLPQGFNVALINLGAGDVTVAKQGSDTLLSEGNKLKLNAQYAQATIVKLVAGSPNNWAMSGSLKA